jgi:hypothetical protein
MIRIFCVFILPLCFVAPCFAASSACGIEQCESRGPELKKNGWNEVARCSDGHQWSYVLTKANESRLCKGINALGGPSEQPCTVYTGQVKNFKKLAADAKASNDAYEKASHEGRLEDFLNARLKEQPQPNCWDVDGK